jgi:hypothetical protein
MLRCNFIEYSFFNRILLQYNYFRFGNIYKNFKVKTRIRRRIIKHIFYIREFKKLVLQEQPLHRLQNLFKHALVKRYFMFFYKRPRRVYKKFLKKYKNKKTVKKYIQKPVRASQQFIISEWLLFCVRARSYKQIYFTRIDITHTYT